MSASFFANGIDKFLFAACKIMGYIKGKIKVKKNSFEELTE